MVHDPWADCLWVLTGDNGDECRILRAACDLSHVDTVLQGKQQARAVAAVPTEHGLYFSSDTPLESNFIYRLDRQGNLSQLAAISSSSIYGCRVGTSLFFSTMVEPSEVNRDRSVRVYGSDASRAETWQTTVGLAEGSLADGTLPIRQCSIPRRQQHDIDSRAYHHGRRIRRHGHFALRCQSVSAPYCRASYCRKMRT